VSRPPGAVPATLHDCCVRPGRPCGRPIAGTKFVSPPPVSTHGHALAWRNARRSQRRIEVITLHCQQASLSLNPAAASCRHQGAPARACSVDRQTQALSPAIVGPTALRPGVSLLFGSCLDCELAVPPLGSCQAAPDQSLTSRDPVSARIAAYVVRRGKELLDLCFLSPT
jgi:hypothetical protein